MYMAKITRNPIVLFLSYPLFSKSFFKVSGIFLGRICVANLLCHASNAIQYLCETADIVTQKLAISFD